MFKGEILAGKLWIQFYATNLLLIDVAVILYGDIYISLPDVTYFYCCSGNINIIITWQQCVVLINIINVHQLCQTCNRYYLLCNYSNK